MGGLLALQEMISHSSVDTIDNITILVGAIKKEMGDFEKITHFPVTKTLYPAIDLRYLKN
jgi:hypothetical protein